MAPLLKVLISVGISMAVAKYCRHSEVGLQSHHRCVTRNESYISYPSPNRHHCVVACSRRLDCQVVNFNESNQICYLTDEPCLVLEPDAQYHALYYKPPSDTCLKWVSLGLHHPDRVIYLYPCNTPDVPNQINCYIIRSIFHPHTLPGLFYYQEESTNKETKYTSLDDQIITTGSWEALEVSPGCPIQWVQYTAGDDLPTKSVVGGHLGSESGSDLYVVRVTTSRNGHEVIIPGYYDPTSRRAYAVFWEVLQFTEMEMLLVI